MIIPDLGPLDLLEREAGRLPTLNFSHWHSLPGKFVLRLKLKLQIQNFRKVRKVIKNCCCFSPVDGLDCDGHEMA